jgi:Asp/Glu/hydantoin racemase
MRLLIINPNTTQAVTTRMAEAAPAHLPAGVALRSVGGRFGARYISSRAAFAVASHAALDAFAEHGMDADCVLLACFGDPGLEALREVSPVPVIGLVEASCREAEARGRFVIVTGGERWGPMLRESIANHSLGGRLAAIETVAPTGGDIAADPQGSIALLAEACRRAMAAHGANCAILGGAGLLGLAAPVAQLLGAPVICSVEAGFRAAAAALAAPRRKEASTHATPSVGLSPALTGLLERGRL